MFGTIVETQLGKIGIEEEDSFIVHVSLSGKLNQSTVLQDTPILVEARKQLLEYCRKERQKFDLPIQFHGTDFQIVVWQQLLQIPYGMITTYGELADYIGKPKASRAVGRACGANPVAIFVPCHRVIGKNQSLTGFAGGIEMKKALLKIEE